MTRKIIQFGEGNFLRAFIDWHIDQLNKAENKAGTANLPFEVYVIQPQPQGMVEMLVKQNCEYTVVLEGLLNGELVQTKEKITAIKDAFDPYTNPEKVITLAKDPELEFIVSNTTEAGIAFDETDLPERGECPKSFPGKIAKLLHARFDAGLPGVKFLPCELIEANGDNLLKTVLQTIDNWWGNELDIDEFKQWVSEENVFYNTLVDRIVPGYPRETADEIRAEIDWEDQLIVKAEPFGLFVIEHTDSQRRAEIESVFGALSAQGVPALDVVVTDKLQPYRERKVKLLNGPHTAMTPLGLMNGVETVREMLEHEEYGPWIDALMRDEIKPTIDLPEKEMDEFIDAVKERFLNPFVKHNLSSIALNSVAKFKTRLLPSLLTYREKFPEKSDAEPTHIMEAAAWLLKFYKSDTPEIQTKVQDDRDVIEKVKNFANAEEFIQALQNGVI